MHACTVACVLRATWVEAPAGTSSVDQTVRPDWTLERCRHVPSTYMYRTDMYMCGRDYGRSSTWPPAFNVGGEEGAVRGPWLNSKPGLKKELWRVTTGHLSQLASFEHMNWQHQTSTVSIWLLVYVGTRWYTSAACGASKQEFAVNLS